MEINKRDKIIDSAKKLFTEYGFKRVSMDEIASYAGVAKGTIYLYFKSKNELFKFFVNEYMQNMEKIIENSAKESSSFFEQLHSGLFAMLKYRKNTRFINTMTREAEMIGTPVLLEHIHTMNKAVVSYIEKKLRCAIDRTEVQKCNTEIMAFLIFKMYMALAYDWEKINGNLDEYEISESISLLFKSGIEA